MPDVVHHTMRGDVHHTMRGDVCDIGCVDVCDIGRVDVCAVSCATTCARCRAEDGRPGPRPYVPRAVRMSGGYGVTAKLRRMAVVSSGSPSVFTRSATASGAIRPQARRK